MSACASCDILACKIKILPSFWIPLWHSQCYVLFFVQIIENWKKRSGTNAIIRHLWFSKLRFFQSLRKKKKLSPCKWNTWTVQYIFTKIQCLHEVRFRDLNIMHFYYDKIKKNIYENYSLAML